MKEILKISALILLFAMASCGGGEKTNETGDNDSLQNTKSDSIEVLSDTLMSSNDSVVAKIGENPLVLIYYFHATHRCATCLAIEDCIDNVLKNEFAEEVKNGQVKLIEVNADDAENEDLCEKYEAFGTSVFVTRVYKGNEKSEDMTADAFKLANSRPDDFEEHLTSQIENYLKP